MSGLRLANAAFALPLKTPALAVLSPTEKLLVSLPCAATPARLPLAVNGPAAPPSVPTSTSFGAATGCGVRHRDVARGDDVALVDDAEVDHAGVDLGDRRRVHAPIERRRSGCRR